MRLLLTSNFPRAGNAAPAAVLRSWSKGEPYHWIGLDPSHYDECRADFLSYGLELDDHRDLLALEKRDHLFIAGGPPTELRSALGPRLASAVTDSSVVAAASGGAMLCTSNLSLFRLRDISARQAADERDQYRGLAYCSFELLPHFDRHSKVFIDEVRRYSEAVAGDIWCLPDGAAIAITDDGAQPIGGALCMRRGELVSP